MYKLNLVWLASLFVLLSACDKDSEPYKDRKEVKEVTAKIIKLQSEQIPLFYEITGTVVSDKQVQIASRIMGFIRDLDVKEGQNVSKGQLLFTIDPSSIEGQVRQASAEMKQAKVSLDEAHADFERFQSMFNDRLVAERDFRKIELQYKIANQRMESAKAAYDTAKSQLQYAEIRSPVAGVVVSKHKRSGDIASPGEGILGIEDPRNLVIEARVRESYIGRVQLNDPVEVFIVALDKVYAGIIAQIIPSGDPVTHTYVVKVTLMDDEKIRPGMFARIKFPLAPKTGIAIPEEAMIKRADIEYVYTVDAEQTARLRMIRTGRHLDGRIEVLSGLEQNDVIIVTSQSPVTSGDHIVVENNER